MSEELKDLILKLIDRSDSTRLGSNGDAEEVMAHPFFSDMNWEALYNREIEAEYKPTISEAERRHSEYRLLNGMSV